MNAFDVVREFEWALCRYTGAPYAVTTSSCTAALLLAVAWHLRSKPPREVLTSTGHHAMAWEDKATIEIPARTYVSVPMSIIHAGGRPRFRDEDWIGAYQLKPLPVWDSARWFTSDLYRRQQFAEQSSAERFTGSMVCCSFHATKTLGDTQGGVILHSNDEADKWLRRMRFDGRTELMAPRDDTFREIGYHCYMSADIAARLLVKLAALPRYNEPLPRDDYPDLSQMDIFK